LRHFEGDDDIETWLELRHRGFARQKVGIRQWSVADFRSEFCEKRWWSHDRIWFAEAEATLLRQAQAVGTVALAMRGHGDAALPVIHWLTVLPTWRRRRIGRLLVAALETACWDAGYREIRLETHVAWREAARFYGALGYQPVGAEPA